VASTDRKPLARYSAMGGALARGLAAPRDPSVTTEIDAYGSAANFPRVYAAIHARHEHPRNGSCNHRIGPIRELRALCRRAMAIAVTNATSAGDLFAGSRSSIEVGSRAFR